MKNRPSTLLSAILLLGTSWSIYATPNSQQASEPIMKEVTLFDKQTHHIDWRIINDSVMGGLSESQYQITQDGTFLFTGDVSLDNNGGFASVRSRPQDLALSDINTFQLKVKGDGNSYQFRLRTNNRWDGVAYTQLFETVDNQWVEIELKVSDFKPTFRGMTVPTAPPLDPDMIQQIGFLIAEKQEGQFEMEVESIKGTITSETKKIPQSNAPGEKLSKHN